MNRLPAILLLAACWAIGCDKIAPPGMGDEEADTTPVATTTKPPATAAPPDEAPDGGAVATFLGLTAPRPAQWQPYPPANPMRAANYRVPGDDGRDDAEVIVFFFGAGMGGTVRQNIDRWVGQFQAPGGGAVEPTISEMEVDGMAVTLVELAGAYRGMGATFRPDTLFLSAVVEAPVGRTFIRLVGPNGTVEAHRDAFMTMVRGLRRTDGQ